MYAGQRANKQCHNRHLVVPLVFGIYRAPNGGLIELTCARVPVPRIVSERRRGPRSLSARATNWAQICSIWFDIIFLTQTD